MQLGKPEALRVLDNHQRGIRNIHPDLNDRCCDEHADFPVSESAHDARFFRRGHATVDKAYCQPRHCQRERGMCIDRSLQIECLAFLDERTDPVGLCARCCRTHHVSNDFGAAFARDQLGRDRLAAWRHAIDGGDFEIGKERHGQGARDGRRAHGQLVRYQFRVPCPTSISLALTGEIQSLCDTEAMLFVNDHEAEIAKTD